MRSLKSLLGNQILFFDGGTGSILQGMGLKPGEQPERWNITNPDKIQTLHYNYYTAGANIIKTDTFGAFSTKFPQMNICQGKDFSLKNVIECAVANANAARTKYIAECQSQGKPEPDCFIAFDIGSCGKLLKPMGDLDFEDCVNLYKETFRIGLKQNVDAVLIETMTDSYETKAAVIAAKETLADIGKDIPVFASNAYDETGHLLTGADPETMVAILEGLGVDALGLNCSLGPDQMKDTVRRITEAASIPVICNPNAGIPREENGRTIFDISPKEFAASMKDIAGYGAIMLGGCCGTNPDYIRELMEAVKDIPFRKPQDKNRTVVSSYTHTVTIDPDNGVPVLIGERLNPTGKKKLKEALRSNDIPYIIKLGLEQEKAGCDVLDVNVGLPEIDEEKMMVRVMCDLQGVTSLPLQIDTSSAEVMESALRRYNGKALVNSVNGKQKVMEEIFPLVKKYGGVVVGLTLDENGIPETAEGRIEIAQRIYDTAAKYGIAKKNIIIDALTMAISTDSNAADATLKTIKTVHDKFGGNTVLGVSNISFGLPNREFITSSFFTLAMHNGLSAAIMNPLSVEMKKAWQCFCLLTGKDKDCLNYISFSDKYQSMQPALPAGTAQGAQNVAASTNKTEQDSATVQYAVIHGLKDDAAKLTQELLKTMQPVEIIDNHIIPGLDYVGQKFEQKQMYLPQLLMAADAAKSAFDEIKSFLEKTGKKGSSKGTVILATVEGDIHDIGKNIKKVLLENYDFTVIDLGKDVPARKIVDCCVQNHVQLVGLCALMTTTVPAMKETIELLKKEAPWAKTVVGGAVLTQEYADSIGADCFAKDAMETVAYAQKVFC